MSEPNRNRLAQRLRLARAEQSVEQIAAALGVSYATVRNWEAGRSTPSSDRLHKLALLVGKPMDWFYSDE